MLDGECSDITGLWQDDLVTFALGCSFSFEEALIADGLDVRNVTVGEDAQGEAVVSVTHGGRSWQGKGFDTDIIVASAKAYLNALNRLAKRQEDTICAKL